MAILQTATTSFKVELPQGIHNFGPTSPDTFKIALYTAAADLGYATAAYTTSGEVVGSGYTAGGNTLTITVTPVAANNFAGTPTAYFSFAICFKCVLNQGIGQELFDCLFVHSIVSPAFVQDACAASRRFSNPGVFFISSYLEMNLS